MKTKRITSLAVLTALSLIMFLVESLFPPLFLPGAKIGLANVFSLLTLVILGPVDALILVIVRTTLGSLFAGGLATLIYSLPAGLVSLLSSALLIRLSFPRISLVAISISSAVLHNLTQNLVYCLVTQTPQMFAYMPYLALAGVLAGFVIGLTVRLIVKILPLSFFDSINQP